MNSRTKSAHRLFSVLAIAAVVLGMALSGPSRPAQAGSIGPVPLPGPQVIPPYAKAYGHTYAEWSDMWWQWAFSMPVDNSALFDDTGDKCGAGQTQNGVWFLAGSFTSSNVVRTNCHIPAGRALFFPIINGECSNLEGEGMTVDELRSCAISQEDPIDVNSLVVTVDGQSIRNLGDYRVSHWFTLAGYNFTLPENNFPTYFGLDAPAGSCFYPDPNGPCVPYLSVSDGYYVMIPPLSVGQHTIHLSGSSPGFTLDISYAPLTVDPQP